MENVHVHLFHSVSIRCFWEYFTWESTQKLLRFADTRSSRNNKNERTANIIEPKKRKKYRESKHFLSLMSFHKLLNSTPAEEIDRTERRIDEEKKEQHKIESKLIFAEKKRAASKMKCAIKRRHKGEFPTKWLLVFKSKSVNSYSECEYTRVNKYMWKMYSRIKTPYKCQSHEVD